MAKLIYAMPLLAGTLALTACPGDDSGSADTENGSSTGDPTTTDPTVTMTTPVTSADGSTTDPTDPTDATTTGVPGCVPECLPGQSCIAGNCVGEPETTGYMCDTWGAGNYNDCVGAGESCEGGSCISDNPMNPSAGACAVLGCTDVCDCPDPSEFEGGLLVCDNLTADMQNGCFFTCADGNECPTGLTCLGGFFCAYPLNPPAPPYGDCANGNTCATGFPVGGPDGECVCMNPCMDVADCPEEPKGSTVVCQDATNDMNAECFLSCGGLGGDCPTDMECLLNFVCVWTVEEQPAPDLPAYGDCIDNPASTCQPGEDVCVVDDAMTPTAGACSQSGCAAPGDCPAAPATGTAMPACEDLGGGNTCFLDCGAAQTCPDGTICTATGGQMACLWEDQGFVLNEDFELGALRPGWTLQNVDMNAPDPTVGYVNDAWVVADNLEAGVNFAAYSTSWYAPAGQADDWLISPQITLGAGSMLSWDGRAPDAAFADGYEVIVSTTGNAVADFTDTPVFTVGSEAAAFTPHVVDLAAAGYADQDVYIAFRNNSNDDFLLLIDNVQVTQ
jgi:hypothetical protein